MALTGKKKSTAAVIEGLSYQDQFELTSSTATTITQNVVDIHGPGGETPIVFISGTFAGNQSNFSKLPLGTLLVSPKEAKLYIKTANAGTATFASASFTTI